MNVEPNKLSAPPCPLEKSIWMVSPRRSAGHTPEERRHHQPAVVGGHLADPVQAVPHVGARHNLAAVALEQLAVAAALAVGKRPHELAPVREVHGAAVVRPAQAIARSRVAVRLRRDVRVGVEEAIGADLRPTQLSRGPERARVVQEEVVALQNVAVLIRLALKPSSEVSAEALRNATGKILLAFALFLFYCHIFLLHISDVILDVGVAAAFVLDVFDHAAVRVVGFARGVVHAGRRAAPARVGRPRRGAARVVFVRRALTRPVARALPCREQLPRRHDCFLVGPHCATGVAGR